MSVGGEPLVLVWPHLLKFHKEMCLHFQFSHRGGGQGEGEGGRGEKERKRESRERKKEREGEREREQRRAEQRTTGHRGPSLAVMFPSNTTPHGYG